MSFPRYPKYKDSGVEWLGEVPEHWEAKPLKHLAEIDSCGSYGVEPEVAEVILPVATTAQIDSDGRFAVDLMPQRGFSPSEVQRYGCSNGDILVVKSSGSATNIISGKAGLVDKNTPPFVFSNFLMRVRPVRELVLPIFLYFQLRSHLTRQRVELMCSTTTYPNLQVGRYSSAPLPVPPLPEQTQIAAFLDRETAKIDELVAEQQRLMELLKEKRQAVISHAVTKGLNPDAPMKPSGIEWLGDVPAHWGVSQSRRMFAVRSEPALATDRILTASQKYGVLFQSDFVEIEGRRVAEVIKGVENLKHVEPDDFIISMRSFQGGIEWCKLCGSTSFHYVMIKPIKGVYPHFFSYLFKSATYIQALRTTTDLIRDGQELRYSNFVQISLPVVPIDEQANIAAFLDTETAKFDALTTEAQRAINLLQERRTALISAAVTGQIDVRAAL